MTYYEALQIGTGVMLFFLILAIAMLINFDKRGRL